MFLALYVKTRANILVEPKLLSHLRCASYEIKTDTEFVLRVQDKFLLLQPLSGRSSESIVFRSVAKRQICYLKSNKNEINEDILTAFQNFKKKNKKQDSFSCVGRRLITNNYRYFEVVCSEYTVYQV